MNVTATHISWNRILERSRAFEASDRSIAASILRRDLRIPNWSTGRKMNRFKSVRKSCSLGPFFANIFTKLESSKEVGWINP